MGPRVKPEDDNWTDSQDRVGNKISPIPASSLLSLSRAKQSANRDPIPSSASSASQWIPDISGEIPGWRKLGLFSNRSTHSGYIWENTIYRNISATPNCRHSGPFDILRRPESTWLSLGSLLNRKTIVAGIVFLSHTPILHKHPWITHLTQG